jgi:hypothetical protein
MSASSANGLPYLLASAAVAGLSYSGLRAVSDADYLHGQYSGHIGCRRWDVIRGSGSVPEAAYVHEICNVYSGRCTTTMMIGVAIFEVKLQETVLTEYSNTWASVWRG